MNLYKRLADAGIEPDLIDLKSYSDDIPFEDWLLNEYGINLDNEEDAYLRAKASQDEYHGLFKENPKKVPIFPLKKTIFRPFNKNIFGFDIETHDDNKEFTCASIYSLKDDSFVTKYSKEDMIELFKRPLFWDSIVAASNLSFDFFGTFFDKPEQQKFKLLMRGSNLLSATTYFKGGDFTGETKKRKLVFVDTMNYSPLSVKRWGETLNLSKFTPPSFLGQKPRNNNEMSELVVYNKRDAEISAKAIKFLYDKFQSLGANCKTTIASTAKSLYTNKYIKDSLYWRHYDYILREQFKGYYGGRTEAFARGLFKNYNYYDFNSLYPSVMLNEFPDPKSLKINHDNTTKYIDSHEGMAEVELESPYADYPLLPSHYNNKMYFPIGNMKGWYSNVELRKALDEGYIIKNVRKTYYYTENCLPFRGYVSDLYDLRKEYQRNDDPSQYVVKLLLNSLYGKFAQKFDSKTNLVPADMMTIELLKKIETPDRIGDFFAIKQNVSPASFCLPIWSLYVTAFGRLKMHDYIKRSRPIYVDTDSLITRKSFDTSTRLGALKLEHRIKEGVIVRPKFYMMKTENKDISKIKGVSLRMTSMDFLNIVQNKTVSYKKFMKIRESLRRGFIPNEIQEITKILNIEDNKRLWPEQFKVDELQYSQPLDLNELDNTQIRNKITNKAIIMS